MCDVVWCDVGGRVGGGLVKVCIFHNQKMHVYLILVIIMQLREKAVTTKLYAMHDAFWFIQTTPFLEPYALSHLHFLLFVGAVITFATWQNKSRDKLRFKVCSDLCDLRLLL